MANTKKKFSFVNIVFFVIFGVLTGVLWAYLCPIPLIPGAVHFRTFAFIIPVIGYLFGPVTGFFAGYIGTIVWALLSGKPAHGRHHGRPVRGAPGAHPPEGRQGRIDEPA